MAKRRSVFFLVVALAAPLAVGCIAIGEDDIQPADNTTPQPASEAGNGTIIRNHTLQVDYYARAASLDTQNMEQTNWEIEIPEGVEEVRAKASWEPSTPLARDQALMLHEGTKEDAGEMFGEPGLGSSPIETPWSTLPENLETVTVMCHVYSSGPTQPVGVEIMQETELTVAFR